MYTSTRVVTRAIWSNEYARVDGEEVSALQASVQPARLAEAILKTLAPHGYLIVIDHAAEYGSGLRDTEKLHRIDPALVKTQVESAGFSFDGESVVLRNTADSHQLLVFNPSVRGHTDQIVFRFRAPD